jgi:hypothetical protein
MTPLAYARFARAMETDSRRGTLTAAWVASCIAVCALLAIPWRTHVDDFDAQLYLVIARNIVRAGHWFDLSFAPGFHPRFREHLPFGFWPAALSIRLLGERAVGPVYAAMTLAAVVAAGRIARRIAGAEAEIAAVLLLGTCETIWHYGGRPLLEPPLFLFATLSVHAALSERWAAAAMWGAIATLIKGPFGLLPLACAATFRIRDRRATLSVLAATVPLGLFLLLDPGGGWRDGYFREQLLKSAGGARSDGIALWWLPFSVIARRFWPGLPFVLFGLWRCLREARLRPLAWTCVSMGCLLCLPARKWGNHTYVVFPMLGAFAGASAAPLLSRLNARTIAAVASSLGAIAIGVLASGIGSRVQRAPCAFSTSLSKALAPLRPGEPILVVSQPPDLAAMAELAAERDLLPYPARELDGNEQIHTAVSHEDVPVPPPWIEQAHAGGWRVLTRGQR